MHRLGSVSYLNAKPLIYGLERDPGVRLVLDVPSALLGGLQRRDYDVALLPVIDYQRMPGLRMLTCGGIGCDGATLTVRIFSHVPFGQVRRMACDTDSHTSVALARVILAERYHTHPQFVDLKDLPGHDADAVLLIGDKVITQERADFAHQIDLGEQWKLLTGLPFLFAAWMARAEAELGDLPERLATARRQGLAHVDEIVDTYGVSRGWPADVARDYLTRHLQFEVGPNQIEAVRLFHQLAHKHGAIESPVRELLL
jgi:chorismate dehydratase